MNRRSARCLAGLLLAAAVGTATAAAPAQAAPTAARTHVHIVWGANRNTWAKFKAAVPLARGVRVYYDSTNPTTWPTTWPTRSGAPCVMLSMRPMPGPLLAGKYDTYFKALFATAPRCSDFTIWHENANGKAGCTVGLCDPLGYPRALRDPARFIKMQLHMEALVKGSHVKFGTIGCGPVASATEWYAPHLDWYGFDFYDNHHYWNTAGQLVEKKLWGRLNANLAAIRQVSGQQNPLIRIGESNSGFDSHRANLFTFTAAWFNSHDSRRTAWIDTYWRAGKSHKQGGLSGPWPPSDTVITRLDGLSGEFQ